MSKQNQHIQQVLANKAQSPSTTEAASSGMDEMAKAGLDEMVAAAAARTDAKADTAPSATDLDAVADEQKAKEATLGINEVEAPPALPKPSKAQLEVLAAEFRQKFSPQGVKRMVDGSIEVNISIGVDMAGCMLAWAEGAGVPPAEFIQTQVTEALAAWTGV